VNGSTNTPIYIQDNFLIPQGIIPNSKNMKKVTTSSGTFEIDFTEAGAFEKVEIHSINGIDTYHFKRDFLNEVEFELGRSLSIEATAKNEQMQEAYGDETERGN
jgi:hypothetical protein